MTLSTVRSPRHRLLEEAGPDAHFVQFSAADTSALVENVARYFAAGISAGGSAVAVVSEGRRGAFLRKLVQCYGAPLPDGCLSFLDADETLRRISSNGYPDARRFDAVVGEEIRGAAARGGPLRAYGEMVGILWSAGQFPAAIRLEQLWNGLRKTTPFALFCAYAIDVFDKEFGTAAQGALLCAHSHLLHSGSEPKLEAALRRAMGDVLGEAHDTVPAAGGRAEWTDLPATEAMILWLRRHLPAKADDILTRARLYYQAAIAS